MKKLSKKEIEGYKKRGICDATDCKGKSKIFYQCKLTEDFESEECVWCEDCCDDGDDMILESRLIINNIKNKKENK